MTYERKIEPGQVEGVSANPNEPVVGLRYPNINIVWVVDGSPQPEDTVPITDVIDGNTGILKDNDVYTGDRLRAYVSVTDLSSGEDR